MRIILQRTLEEHEDVEAGEAAEAAAVHRDQKQPFRKVRLSCLVKIKKVMVIESVIDGVHLKSRQAHSERQLIGMSW